MKILLVLAALAASDARAATDAEFEVRRHAMTDLLKPSKQDRVLEVGTGSGYQAAVLAELVRSVYTIEIVEPLAVEARERPARLGYRNVEVRTGDGCKGWESTRPSTRSW